MRFRARSGRIGSGQWVNGTKKTLVTEPDAAPAVPPDEGPESPTPDTGQDTAPGHGLPAASVFQPDTVAVTGVIPGSAGSAGSARVHTFVLLGLGLGACYLIAVMLWPFFPAIVTSAVLAVLVFPLYRRFRRHLGRRNVAAMLMTIIVFVLILLPALGLGMLLLDEIRAGIERLSASGSDLVLHAGRLTGWIDRFAGRFGFDAAELGRALHQQAQNAAATLAGRTFQLFTGLGGILLQAGIALFTLYYLLRDGEALVTHLKWLLPLEPDLSERLFRRANEITHATILGNIVVAAVQGTIGGLVFWAVGVRAPVLWGTVMGVFSLLPAIGPAFIWFPAAILQFAQGHPVKGIVLLALGSLVISTVDNVLRALLVSDRAQLHPLVVFFSVLGGLFVFGAIGMFVGPVLFVVALTLLEVARLTIGPPGPPRPDFRGPA
jgi:predicted PurR-regulated permease PerM